jgi:hypothetical protein
MSVFVSEALILHVPCLYSSDGRRAIALEVRRQFLTADFRIRTRFIPYKFLDGRNGTAADISESFPVRRRSTLLSTAHHRQLNCIIALTTRHIITT